MRNLYKLLPVGLLILFAFGSIAAQSPSGTTVEKGVTSRFPAGKDVFYAPYRFAPRTNLLYDAFLMPTLGIEWRATQSLGIKLDGSYAYWGDEHGKVQKIWLVSPEVRWYMGGQKCFYLGAGANFGEYNIYEGMIGGMFGNSKGYQGTLWGAGLTVGYQLYLSRSFSLDFNLGLGYTSFNYDSFTVTDGTRVYVQKDKSKDFWGPTQAGISLVWTIRSSK